MDTCLLCGDESCVDISTGRKQLLYHRCTDCGYIFLDPSERLAPEQERARYALHRNTVEDEGYVAWLLRFLDFAVDFQPEEGGTVLDFGSGPEPVMAGILEDRGYQVLKEDTYYAPGRREGPFRLICAVEVLEHLSSPMEVIQDLSSRLEPNGILCISTEFAPESTEDFKTWHYRSDPTHIGFFTRESLTSAARSSGLQELRCDGIRYAAYGSLAGMGRPC